MSLITNNIKTNKWIAGTLPAILLHICIGNVYCWSLLKGPIATEIGCPVASIEFAFSLAIFFLGMSAAFGGSIVEKNVKYSSLSSALYFVGGLTGTMLAMYLHSVVLLFVFYGCIMGIGLGLGYLSPIKTLMLWFYDHKGLATGIAISGFGLSKVIMSPFIVWCNTNYNIFTTITIIGLFSLICMLSASFLIHKPSDWIEHTDKKSLNDFLKIIFNPLYILIWIMFYLNITAGLAIISFESNIASYYNISAVGLLAAGTALFNTLGRFGYASVSDKIQNKAWIYVIIFSSSLIAAILGLINIPTLVFTVIIAMFIINAGYGGGFSALPVLLESKFGMKNISTIHGLCLSAWAFAGLSGNNITNYIINELNGTYNDVFITVGCMYFIALGISIYLTSTNIKASKNSMFKNIRWDMFRFNYLT